MYIVLIRKDDKDLYAIDIHKMHLNFGSEGIGYHKVICISGEIENGRPEYWKGQHFKGKNEISLGIYLIGRNEFKQKQYLSLEKVIKIEPCVS